MAKVRLTPESGTPCKYSARHQRDGVQAVVFIDMGRVGVIPCCRACADFYRHQAQR